MDLKCTNIFSKNKNWKTKKIATLISDEYKKKDKIKNAWFTKLEYYTKKNKKFLQKWKNDYVYFGCADEIALWKEDNNYRRKSF